MIALLLLSAGVACALGAGRLLGRPGGGMRVPMFTAVATALLRPGAITQRVVRVGRPSREARELLDALRAQHRPVVRRRDPVAKRPGSPFTVINISLYDDVIARLDAAVAEARARGFLTANRSALIRLALERVDFTELP